MRLIVSNRQAATVPIQGIPTENGLYRAKPIAAEHLRAELAKINPTDANGKPNPLHQRIVEAMKPENIASEYAHEGKVYACILGQIREFNEATGEVGGPVDVRRWAEPFAFEGIVCTITPSL
jgi:hypothetical protein